MSGTDLASDRLADALQRVLATEHAAVWAFGSLGAATSQSATPELLARVGRAWEEHRGRRDRLHGLLLELGREPVGSEAAYTVPSPIGRPDDVERAAVRVERAGTQAWAFLVASTTGGTRRWAAGVLTELAVSAVRFGAEPEPMPGAGDLLPR
ncbi:ferritin-like domain-containing protein [uncultured Nocardioides sp.]|uniref:ferritin-like domain-containing protein n=1 Tax=uncultured Nocardioides sp. TaxID=198441 RepID=UPI0026394F12|nr:ferritin-like domain-containing protein [uncultured Nocardioides sp.]